MTSDRSRILLATLLLLAAATISWFTLREERTAFHDIAYPCLPLDVATTDPTQFVMVNGHDAPPGEHTMPDGTVVYAVFSHPDPKVVPLVDGKTLYFPARLIGEDDLETPPLPPANRPLPKAQRFSLVRYLPDEIKQQLKSAIAGSGSQPPTGTEP